MGTVWERKENTAAKSKSAKVWEIIFKFSNKKPLDLLGKNR